MKLSFSVPMMARFRTLVGKSTSEQQGARMHFRVKKCVSVLATAALLFAPEIPARPQDKPHVVSLIDLNLDAARVAQTRQANEEAVRTLLSFEEAQKALKSVHLDYQKVDKAVGQLSDEDLAKLASDPDKHKPILPPDASPTGPLSRSLLSSRPSSSLR